MKKLLIIATVAVALTGCVKTETAKDYDKAWIDHGNDCKTKVVTIENHKYILMDGYHAGTIIHAASCNCNLGM